jgi:endonuclease/exonuclease/phosphatase family metal-dependent hydrolase
MRRLRVVTWNVGRLYSPRGNNRLDDADVPQVARVLAELDPEVVLLQELVGDEQLAGLTQRLPDYEAALARRCRYDRRVAALVRRGLQPRFEQHVLEPSGRGIVSAHFAVAGRELAAFSTHFDVFRPRRRGQQARELLALAEARPEPLLIVAGDFNLDPEWAARVGGHVDVATFARLTEQLADAGRGAGKTLLHFWRVDHALVRGARSFGTRVSPRRLPMGDHHPLVLDVDVALDVSSPGNGGA